MLVVLVSLFVSMVVEVLLFGWLWRGRRVLAGLATGTAVFGSVLLLLISQGLWVWLLAGATAYRVFNLIRTANEHLNDAYVRRSGRQASQVLMRSQLAVIGLWALWAWSSGHVSMQMFWFCAALLSLTGGALMFVSAQRNLRKTRPHIPPALLTDRELPTLTVAIPARNETLDLQQCLESLIASDYPKLEILVLDDCSQNRRTPEIIKGFAHDGVRFVAGEEVREGWLAKNQAYAKLAEGSSGELVLFCGVDIRFEKQTLRELVSSMMPRHKHMIAMVPMRSPQATGRFSLIQPMRYYWELMPPRRLFNRPPVLSSCWIVRRQFLEKVGGFEAVSRMIVPEAYFAQQALREDGYSFVRANKRLGIWSVKGAAAQRSTAVRTRYPQLHRRIDLVAGVMLLELLTMITPFVLVLIGLLTGVWTVTWVISLLACGFWIASYELLVRAVRFHGLGFGLVAFPLMILADIGMMHYSMWKYEFSTVEWKGRNVCLPIMQVIPRLPQL